jgi:hypothetical protein
MDAIAFGGIALFALIAGALRLAWYFAVIVLLWRILQELRRIKA